MGECRAGWIELIQIPDNLVSSGLGDVLHVRIRYGDGEHAGRARGFDPGRRIFKNEAVFGIRLSLFAASKKMSGAGFPADFRIVSDTTH